MPTRILIADDHQIFREGLRSLLEKQPDLHVVAEAADGQAAVCQALELRPHVVVMAVTMPHLNGVEATRRILAEAPEIKVVALSMHASRELVVNMLKAGAAGYVLKDSAFHELALAIRTVLDGHPYLSPRIAEMVLKDYLPRVESTEESSLAVLTTREREILQLLGEGKSTREIALMLSLNQKTIDGHRQHVMEKLGLASHSDLVKFALRKGLISMEM